MKSSTLTINEDYWNTLEVKDNDLEFLYNHLLELETPLTTEELTKTLVIERINREKLALLNQHNTSGDVYLPKDKYRIGQKLTFPAMNFIEGEIVSIRTANNPDFPTFNVIEVSFSDHTTRLFASGLDNHKLNTQPAIQLDDPLLETDYIIEKFGSKLSITLLKAMESSIELARVGTKWFPRALVLDVNIGHLNLAEAFLDMENGGPVTTQDILAQIDLKTDVNKTLTEFSLDLALEEDERFDEVGPAGEVLWFLKKLEPQAVLETPKVLRYKRVEKSQKSEELLNLLEQFEGFINDELESNNVSSDGQSQVAEISLIYPHWRSGTLPLSIELKKMFPTSLITPRIQFTFVDEDNKKKFPGWVVREGNYVYGLSEWYEELGLMPGSLVYVRKSKNSGEIIIHANRQRPSREWIRTVLVGADNGVVFAMLKQLVTAKYHERMAIAIPDIEALDHMWEHSHWEKKSLESIILIMMRELTKLNPQGHVHAQELYAVVNIVRRCPPGEILSILIDKPWAVHLGDLYFRLNTDSQEE